MRGTIVIRDQECRGYLRQDGDKWVAQSVNIPKPKIFGSWVHAMLWLTRKGSPSNHLPESLQEVGPCRLYRLHIEGRWVSVVMVEGGQPQVYFDFPVTPPTEEELWTLRTALIKAIDRERAHEHPQRIHIDFGQEAATRLAQMAEAAETSEEGVIRDALRLYDWYSSRQAEGFELYMAKDDLERKVELLFGP